jgi:hypothetical protein
LFSALAQSYREAVEDSASQEGKGFCTKSLMRNNLPTRSATGDHFERLRNSLGTERLFSGHHGYPRALDLIHSRLGPEGHMGHLITKRAGETFSPSPHSHSQTSAGKPTLAFGIS